MVEYSCTLTLWDIVDNMANTLDLTLEHNKEEETVKVIETGDVFKLEEASYKLYIYSLKQYEKNVEAFGDLIEAFEKETDETKAQRLYERIMAHL